MTFATILPDLDAARGGVAAYALELAARQSGGLAATRFIALRCPSPPPAPAATVIKRDARALAVALADLRPSRILLHFSGYGFAPDACPHWLLHGLQLWRGAQPDGRLVIYFHELITEEPWWTRTHWTQPRQKRIVDGLATLADAVVTNCPYFVDRLGTRHRVPAAKVTLAPVPPTLADVTVPLAEPRRHAAGLALLVFGLRGTRQRTLKEHARLLRRLAQHQQLAHLMLAGEGARIEEATAVTGSNVRLTAHPDLDAVGLRQLAAKADAGLLWNWAPILTKSTVFANLCALGVPAVISGRAGTDPGFGGEPAFFVGGNRNDDIDRVREALADPTRLAAIRARARALAEEHLSWPRTVARIDTALGR